MIYFRLRAVSRLLPVLLMLWLGASLPALRAQLVTVGDGGPGPFKAQHLTAELVSLAPSVAPGGNVEAGLTLTMEQKWHVYWINAGDSGEPPSIKWTLPAGVTAGPMRFPIPSRLPLGPLMDFGYEDNVTFPVRISIAPTVKPGPVRLDAMVSWLVCREVCIPGKAHMGLTLNVAPNAAPGQRVGALGEAIGLLPRPLPEGMSVTVTGGKEALQVRLKTGQKEEDAQFYPFDQDVIQNATVQPVETEPDGVAIRVARAPELTALPTQLHGIVRISDELAYEFTAPVQPGMVAAITPADVAAGAASDAMTQTEAATAAASSAAAAASSTAKASGTTALTAPLAIALAFLGGILLNLMPCVFPVLFLKGLALVQSSGEQRHRLRSHGIVYTLGILVSFWVIVGVLLGLRAGGREAGWGFQLQSPVFISILACGLFFFALSLAGVFDLGLSMTSVGGGLAEKQGYAGSFFTGVLATIVATPCTAPLMGAAIGFALVQPAWITFAVFTALGLGLALPYLLLSAQPAWTRILPRPGAWMEVLKQLTAVPLFGTAIWLAWVYGELFSGTGISGGEGADHMARILWAFLVLAIAGWVLGRWPLKALSTVAAVVLCGCALAIPIAASSRTPRAEKLAWQPYSQSALDAARTAGHPVFIDFTAAWCLSCQVNEKAVLQSAEVEQALTRGKVTLLRADWTQYEPEITRELATLKRSGVPTYVIYPKTQASAPDVLPELLTKSAVLSAIQRDASQ